MNDDCTEVERSTQPPTPEGFIGKPEVARRLGRTTRTVDTWMQKGILPYYKPDRRVLFRWQDVEQHIIANYRMIGPNRATSPNIKDNTNEKSRRAGGPKNLPCKAKATTSNDPITMKLSASPFANPDDVKATDGLVRGRSREGPHLFHDATPNKKRNDKKIKASS